MEASQPSEKNVYLLADFNSDVPSQQIQFYKKIKNETNITITYC